MVGNVGSVFTWSRPVPAPAQQQSGRRQPAFPGLDLGGLRVQREEEAAEQTLIMKNCVCLFQPVWGRWRLGVVPASVPPNLDLTRGRKAEDIPRKHCKANEWPEDGWGKRWGQRYIRVPEARQEK